MRGFCPDSRREKVRTREVTERQCSFEENPEISVGLQKSAENEPRNKEGKE